MEIKRVDYGMKNFGKMYFFIIETELTSEIKLNVKRNGIPKAPDIYEDFQALRPMGNNIPSTE